MLVVALNIGGLLGLVVGIYAFVQNRSAHRKHAQGRARLVALGVGVAFAAASTILAYPVGSNARVVGIPFTVAFFEGGADFVGPLSLPAFVGNMTFWFVCPQIVLWWMRRRARARSAS